MNCLTSKLIVYRNIDKESILFKLSEILRILKEMIMKMRKLLIEFILKLTDYFLLQLVMVLIRTYGIII